MEDYLQFAGPVKLLIVERALLLKQGRARREGEKTILTRLVFNQQGNPVSELREKSSVEYLYNESQQLVLVRERSKSGDIIEETKTLYASTYPAVRIRTSTDGSEREHRLFQYNASGQLVQEKCGSRIYRYEYKGDQLLKEYRYYGKDPEVALLYTYDEEGNTLSIKSVDKSGKLLREERFTYENNLLSGKTIIRNNGSLLCDETYEYDCFHEGNWLKRIRYNNLGNGEKEPVEIIYRSIAYSDTCPQVKPMIDSAPEILKEENQSLTFSDGSTYRGDIKEGKMEGKGYIQWPDGSSYKGEFRQNHMEGQGILTWPNGDIYSGDFTGGKMEGIGRLRWTTGKTFYGLFEENRRTNQGIIEEE